MLSFSFLCIYWPSCGPLIFFLTIRTSAYRRSDHFFWAFRLSEYWYWQTNEENYRTIWSEFKLELSDTVPVSNIKESICCLAPVAPYIKLRTIMHFREKFWRTKRKNRRQNSKRKMLGIYITKNRQNKEKNIEWNTV